MLLAAVLLSLGVSEGGAEPARRPDLARGKFLVASDRLVDPNFRETVILLLEYAESGALGVVINRPTDVKLTALLPEIEELHGRADLVFLGGPVARDRMILLVRASSAPEESARVLDGVFITSSLEVLREMSRAPGEERFRTYVGYAGWGPRQLDAEIARGDWNVTAAEPVSLFEKDPGAVWPELNERASGRWVRAPAPLPEQPSVRSPKEPASTTPSRAQGRIALARSGAALRHGAARDRA